MLAIPFYFLLVSSQNKKIVSGQKNIMVAYSVSESNYISTIQGVEPIKNYNKQAQFSSLNKKVYQNYQETIFTLGKIQIKLSLIANIFGVMFLIGLLFFNANQVLKGSLKIGELMATIGICGSLLPSIANLALISIPFNEAKIAFDRMFEFTTLDKEKEENNLFIEKFESLKCSNLSFRFAGRSPIIKNISFEIKKGEVIAIMGENGCGKSTLTQLLMKNYEQENGEIIINNSKKINDISISDWRKIVGVIPQSIHIFNGTVLENICFEDAIEKPDKVFNFLQANGFSSFLDSLPQSVYTLVGEEGINLSGGQKQIIAFARALYFKPQLLIIDEGTSAMDRLSEQFVINLIQKLKNEIAVIFITHRLHILKSFSDKIYVLENGSITIEGNHEFLMTSDNLYSKYWNDLQS